MSTKQGPILQAGAIPYRGRSGQHQFCLITSLKGRWGFPKGIIETGDSAVVTAAKEALEEAGVEGVIDEDPLGSYEHAKWETTLNVTLYLMHVSPIHDKWTESQRSRCWVSADEALELLSNADHRRLLSAAVARLRAE